MDFQETLTRFRAQWHALDAEGLVQFFSANYTGSYAHQLDQVDTSSVDTALRGWSEAFSQLQPLPCQWEFADEAIRPIGDVGMLVIGWVRLRMNGKVASETFRMEVWRREDRTWRLLRDHQEYNIQPAEGEHG